MSTVTLKVPCLGAYQVLPWTHILLTVRHSCSKYFYLFFFSQSKTFSLQQSYKHIINFNTNNPLFALSKLGNEDHEYVPNVWSQKKKTHELYKWHWRHFLICYRSCSKKLEALEGELKKSKDQKKKKKSKCKTKLSLKVPNPVDDTLEPICKLQKNWKKKGK